MSKFTKITATAFFSIFLTACDQPTQKAETKVETIEVTQPSAQTEEVKSEVDVEGAADFRKIVEWNQIQEKNLAEAQNALQQKLETQDKAQIEEGLKLLKLKVDEILASLDAVEVRNSDVANFKTKTKETLTLSNELIAESVKIMATPTAELQNIILEKTQKLMQSSEELQQLQSKLEAKFGMK